MSKFIIDKSTSSVDGQDGICYRLLGEGGNVPGSYFQDNRPGLRQELAASKSAVEIVKLAKERGATAENCSWPGHKAGTPVGNITLLDRSFASK